MILNKEMSIYVNSATIEHFTSLGYKNLTCGTKLNIPIEHMNSGSNLLVKVKCDICGNEKDLKYRTYLKNIYRQGYYSCSSKCGKIKRRSTCLKIFGTENPNELNILKQKIKKIKLEKYGDENYNNSNKNKETCLNRYGVENPSQLEDIKNKKIQTSLKNWGVEYPVQNSIISNKISITAQKNRKYDIKELNEYRYKITLLTNRKRKKMLENWNGYDYYDGEYIKNNLSLHSNDRNYPTIDHKKSVMYCFMNSYTIEEVCDINNLCITKRYINCIKNKKNEEDFNF